MKTSVCLLALALLSQCRPESATQLSPDAGGRVDATTLVRRSGQKLLGPDGRELWLRGVAFGNEIWSNAPLPPTTHHNEQDYVRVKDMGMNAIRFYLNYRFFEDDARPYQYKQTGWAWIDQNVAWAKKHGIYLILNMHAPQGGYQSQGNGGALWDVPENQKRLVALWTAIARRYANEPTIAGYDLVNEPVTTRDIGQWQTLAQQLVDAIRTVDKGHLIVVERLNAVGKEWRDFNGERNLFLVRDENVLYQFHTYDPFEYTHQLFDWANTGDGGKYPDPDKISAPSDARWYSAVFNNPPAPAGTSGWRYYEGVPFKITDANMKLALPVCVAANLGGGRIWIDDVVVKEYDESGRFVRDVVAHNVVGPAQWYFWSQNGSGRSETATEGHNDAKSLTATGTTGDANFSGHALRFIPRQGYTYRTSGWLKAENLPATANVRWRLDFETTNQPVYGRDKNYLASALQFYIDWGRRNNVPMYMGEFGAGRPCFANNKGGTQWVSDIIDIARPAGLHFTYHAYHEDSFGIYPGYGRLPVESEGNRPLIDLFKTKLK